MALLCSAVTVTSEDDQAEFLVGGIPKTYSELEGWTAFDNLMNTVDSEQEIQVHVAACLYGEGEPFNATPEEIAYLTRRAEADHDFFYGHCKNTGHSDFTFTRSPEESYGMEMEL